MSDNWEIYHADIAGQTAHICFNDGVAQTIDQLDLPNLLKLQVVFGDPGDNGMPDESELMAHEIIEEEVASWAEDSGGIFVGLVTGASTRTFLCYTNCSEEDAGALAEHLIMLSGLEIGMKFEADPGNSTYWNELCPSIHERQIMSDMKVIEQLEAYNDNLSAPRRIDHYAYFDSRQQTEMFVNWARKSGFAIEQMTAPTPEVAQHMVMFHHDCCPLPEEISSHTTAVAANANRLGGQYRGWTTTAQAH